MSSTNNERYWFKRKKNGYGWTPSTWQGWAVIAAYMISLMLGIWFIMKDIPNDDAITIEFLYALIWSLLMVAALFYVTIKKGPKARWQKDGKPVKKKP